MNDKTDTVTRWSKIAALIATLATIVSGFNAMQVNRFESDLKKVQAERELNFKIYSSIADALESGDPKRVLAVRGIVEAMASDSIKPAFRQALEPAMQRVFEQEQLALLNDTHDGPPPVLPAPVTAPPMTEMPIPDDMPEPKASLAWNDWDFDIFWCASAGVEAESLANTITYALKKDGAKGRIRARVLPDSVNQRSAYGAWGVEIRRSDNEAAMANKLASFAETLPAFEQLTIRQKTTTQDTPWYISMFVCPGLQKAP